MRIDILTLFPEMFQGPFQHSIVKRAMDSGLVGAHIHDIRCYTHDRHHTADDYQYGGGSGMVMKPDPFFEGVEAILSNLSPHKRAQVPVVLMSPQGRLLNQDIVEELSRKPHLVLLCGHYDGVDERVRDHLISDELSLGDYVLTGGELAAMTVVDAVVRLLPGAVGSAESVRGDSITSGLLQHPIYTHPSLYRSYPVPQVLLSGHHEEIRRWRRQQSLRRTLERRPDLLAKAHLTPEDIRFLDSLGFQPKGRSEA